MTTTSSYGSNPELGLTQSKTLDPTGLNLTTAMAYEPQGATNSYLRQTSKTLPGGNITSYTYYSVTNGTAETRDNPCTTGITEAYSQAGFFKLKPNQTPMALAHSLVEAPKLSTMMLDA